MTAALLLWLAVAQRVEVANQEFEVPANDWRYVAHPVSRAPALLDCLYETQRTDARVRVVLLSREQLESWRGGREHEEIAATVPGPRGLLRLTVHEEETYAAIENRGTATARVHLMVFVEEPQARVLSAGRRLAVISISLAVFVAMAGFSGARLLRAMRN